MSVSVKVVGPTGFGVLSMENPVVSAPVARSMAFGFVLSSRPKRRKQTCVKRVEVGLVNFVDVK